MTVTVIFVLCMQKYVNSANFKQKCFFPFHKEVLRLYKILLYYGIFIQCCGTQLQCNFTNDPGHYTLLCAQFDEAHICSIVLLFSGTVWIYIPESKSIKKYLKPGRNSFRPVSILRLLLNRFLSNRIMLDIFQCTDFNENLIYFPVAATRRQMDGRTWCPHKLICFYYVKKVQKTSNFT